MKRALIGAGGFAREIMAHMGEPKMVQFVDDFYWNENGNYIYPLSKFDPNEYEVLVAIGNPKERFEMVQRLPLETKYFTFIHPSAQLLSGDIEIGKGSIVCAGCILTTNIKIGDHAHLNLQSTIGHDCEIGDFFTTAPGARISGNCKIHDCVYVGTNASIKNRVFITGFTTIGLGAGVVKNIEKPGTYIGCPAKILGHS